MESIESYSLLLQAGFLALLAYVVHKVSVHYDNKVNHAAVQFWLVDAPTKWADAATSLIAEARNRRLYERGQQQGVPLVIQPQQGPLPPPQPPRQQGPQQQAGNRANNN